jgi:mannose-6-phosphate isomerase-like protein (cupin superfamily)
VPGRAVVSPLATWVASPRAVAGVRRRLGRARFALPPRDRAWRALVPGFDESRAMLAAGLPFQVVAERRYDRSAAAGRLPRALAEGATVYAPQIHQVLPRVARLMVALRAALLGPFREACSFLFLVEGRGRPGMGLHHDAEVDSFWLQLEGRRTVTVGPPVPPGAPRDLGPDWLARHAAGVETLDLEPGTLLHLPPRTPHDVVCHGRSLALSLTWRRLPPARARALADAPVARVAASLVDWDVVSGRVPAPPPASPRRLWTQVPVLAGPLDRARRAFPLATPAGALWLPARLRPFARDLALMPAVVGARREGDLAPLLAHGILADQDLPLRVVPDDLAALDGWRFA